MAYSEQVKLKAYSLYLQNLNYEEIAEKLASSSGTTIQPQTIRSWAVKKDKDGFSWQEERDALRESVKASVQKKAQNKLTELESKVETLQESLYNQLMAESAPKVGSFEGGIYAFKALADFQLMLDKNKNEKHPLLLVQMLLTVLEETPRVRKVISANWDKIQSRLAEKMGKAELYIEPQETKKKEPKEEKEINQAS